MGQWARWVQRGCGVLTGIVAMAPAINGAVATEADWAQLSRYRAANAALGAPAPGEARVVFMGDSITEGWGRIEPSPFDRPGRINRGISGQTTPQMLVRFRDDVIALRPRVVVLLAGTNDIAGNTGEATVDEIAGHLRSMVQLARAEGIAVVLCSVLPAAHYPWRPGSAPAARIVELNGRLHAMAQALGTGWVDYHAALDDGRGGLRPEHADDGVHPSPAAYAVMGRLVEPALEAALKPR